MISSGVWPGGPLLHAVAAEVTDILTGGAFQALIVTSCSEIRGTDSVNCSTADSERRLFQQPAELSDSAVTAGLAGWSSSIRPSELLNHPGPGSSTALTATLPGTPSCDSPVMLLPRTVC